jgi:anti-anti-sigma factor
VVEVLISEAIDLAVIARLDVLFDDALALRPKELVVDLADCPFLNASAISLLVDVHRRALKAGSVLTLRTVSPQLQRNLRLARVDRVLRVTPPEPSPPNAVSVQPQ